MSWISPVLSQLPANDEGETALLSPEGVRRRLSHLGASPRHHLGQNFLVDGSVIHDALTAAQIDGCDVIEFGGGLGVLTSALARRARNVAVAEIDDACVRALTQLSQTFPNIQVHAGDARDLDGSTLGWGKFCVVANIPYQLTGQLMRHVSDMRPAPLRCVLLVQKEVAYRVAAKPGDWGLSTVAVRTMSDAAVVRDVSRHSFFPEPRVDSALLMLTPYRVIDDHLRGSILNVARVAFAQRRKTLRRVLGDHCGSASRAQDLLEKVSIDSSRRAQTLTLEEWERLAREWGEVSATATGKPPKSST